MNDQTKICPRCAEEIQSEAKVCRFCGASFKVSQRGYCTNCHQTVQAKSDGTCAICGSELIDRRLDSRLKEAKPPATESETAPPPSLDARTIPLLPIKGEGVNWRLLLVLLAIPFNVLCILMIISPDLLTF